MNFGRNLGVDHARGPKTPATSSDFLRCAMASNMFITPCVLLAFPDFVSGFSDVFEVPQAPGPHLELMATGPTSTENIEKEWKKKKNIVSR